MEAGEGSKEVQGGKSKTANQVKFQETGGHGGTAVSESYDVTLVVGENSRIKITTNHAYGISLNLLKVSGSNQENRGVKVELFLLFNLIYVFI